ncbi:hypothetical protein V6Z11_A11G246400 [Gossypium hirsutum]
MAKSSADDAELRRACQAAIEDTKQKVVMSIRVVKSHGMWGKTSVSSVTSKLGPMAMGRQNMAKPRIIAISTKAKGQRTKAFLRVLKYSTGGVIEAAELYKLKHLSKVEVQSNDPSGCTFTLEHTPSVTTQKNQQDGPVPSTVIEGDLDVTVEKELVSQAEEEDMEALLGTYVVPLYSSKVLQ